jgi:hypothetical protein
VNDPARLAQVFTVMPKSTAYQALGLTAIQGIGANMAGGTEPVG